MELTFGFWRNFGIGLKLRKEGDGLNPGGLASDWERPIPAASPSGGRCRFPIDRHDLVAHLPVEIVGVLPHGADRLLVGAGGALDAVVPATRALENLVEAAFRR